MIASRCSHLRLSSGVLTVLASSASLLALGTGTAHAQAFLVGFELFSPDATGNNQGNGYTYTTNSNIDFARDAISLNGGAAQQTAISFALTPGSDVFSFNAQANFPTSIAGINLFFNSTGASFNPTTSTGVAGNLTAVANTDSSGSFFFPTAGTPVRSYDNGSDAAYSGSTFFNVGGERISITQYSVNNTPSGTFTLSVTPQAATAPEPGSVILLVTGVLSVAGVIGRRRTAKAASTAA